jgi:hypothetical protein
MKEVSFYGDTFNKDQFKIDYPYYGLFGSAVITLINDGEEVVYKCKLLNGSTVFLKKILQTKKWIDVGLSAETPLSATIGLSIDDFQKIKKGV